MSKTTVESMYFSSPHRSGLSLCTLVCGLLVASGTVFAAGVNPLVAPPPSVKVEPGGGAPGLTMPPVPPTAPARGAPSLGLSAPGQEQAEGATVFAAEKWLAQAIVTSTVGDRASIVVPVSLTEALAANSTSVSRALQQNYMPMPQMPQMGMESKVAATVGQPQVAVQQSRQEVLYVRTGRPFFFKGEKFSVEVLGTEVTIWRAGRSVKSDAARDIVYIGSVASTEMVRSPVVGTFATPDPAVLKRITPIYSTSTSTNSTSGAGTAPVAK